MTIGAGPVRYVLFCLVCGGTFTLGAAAGLFQDNHRIAEGVFIDQAYVGGLTPDEAAARVRDELVKPLGQQVELRDGTRRWNLTDAKFGRQIGVDEAVTAAYRATRTGGALARGRARLDAAEHGLRVPLRVTIDRAQLEARLAQLSETIDREPVDAAVAGVVGNSPWFNSEQPGRRLKIVESADLIEQGGQFPPPQQVALTIEAVEPELRVAELRASLNTVLAQHTTSMSDGYAGVMRENRAHNVRLLLERMGGAVLKPGEVWSFNGDLGGRKASDGFKSSVIFMRRPDGTIDEEWSTGGGICQLATTIFNAALLANMEIVERGNHSKTVHYAVPARDATVYYGVVDLKFRNPLSRPVMMWGELRSNYDLAVTFLGDRADEVDVKLDSNYWYGGAGKGGSLWRTVRTLGGEIVKDREHICDSFYPYPKPEPKP